MPQSLSIDPLLPRLDPAVQGLARERVAATIPAAVRHELAAVDEVSDASAGLEAEVRRGLVGVEVRADDGHGITAPSAAWMKTAVTCGTIALPKPASAPVRLYQCSMIRLLSTP